jgi:glycosyltransferase involved in cell wall biosynthesis
MGQRGGGDVRVAHLTVVHREHDPRIHRKQCVTLADAGYEVHLLIGGDVSGVEDGIRMHSLSENSERPPLRRQWRRQLRASRQAPALGADLYHLHDPHLIPLGVALKLRGAKVVYDVHEHYPNHARAKLAGHPVRATLKAAMWRVLEATARSRFDGFVCASAALAERFPADRTIVLNNFPILHELALARHRPPLAERDPVALYLGCNRPDRGLHHLVEAARLLPDDLGSTIRLVGEIRPAHLAEEIRGVPWADRIEILPERRSRAWVAEQLSQAALGLALMPPLLNSNEGWRSNKLFEYMAAGLPVIVPDAPRWREITDRYECGLAVPAEDPAAIAAAISKLLRDSDLSARLGDNGRRAVESELNWEMQSASLLELYERLVGLPELAPQAVSPAAETPVEEPVSGGDEGLDPVRL